MNSAGSYHELAEGKLTILKIDVELPDTGFCAACLATPRSAAAKVAHETQDLLRHQMVVERISLLF